MPKAGASFRSGRHRDGATRPGGCAHLERLAALRVFVDPRLGGSVGIPCHGARSVPRAARTSGAWLGSGLMWREGKRTRDASASARKSFQVRLEGPFLQTPAVPAADGKKRHGGLFLIGRDTEARANFCQSNGTSERPRHSSSRRTRSPRAASPSNTVVLVMSLAVVAPHRAPSIDPALRAFLAECLDGTDVDGDVGDVPSSDVPDLPRALSFDDADVDLSGICAWLEGDVGLATNVDVDDDVVDARAKKRARPGSLDDDSVRPTPRTHRGGDERDGRGRSPATPPRRDERSDEPGSVEYSDPTSDPTSDPAPSITPTRARPEAGSAAAQPRVRRAEPPAQAIGARAPATEVQGAGARRRALSVRRAVRVARKRRLAAATRGLRRRRQPRRQLCRHRRRAGDAPPDPSDGADSIDDDDDDDDDDGAKDGSRGWGGSRGGEITRGGPGRGRRSLRLRATLRGRTLRRERRGVYLMRYATRGVASTPRGSLAE